MPGHLWYLFPSNGDLVSGFTDRILRPEILYTPFRLGSDGWISDKEGATIRVHYGPVRTGLNCTEKQLDEAKRDGVPAHSVQSQYAFYEAPMVIGAGTRRIDQGYLRADPTSKDNEIAFYSTQPGPGLRYTRDEFDAYLADRLKP